MAALILFWALGFAAFTGLGTVVPLSRSSSSPYAVFDKFWAGVALVCAVLQIVQLCLPLKAPVPVLLIFGIGLPLAGVRWWTGRPALRRWMAPMLVLCPLIVWSAAASLGDPPQWDFGLYHLPAVRWAESYAIVPGLANLYVPLGQNSVFWLLAAAIDPGSWAGLQVYQVAGGLFVVALAAECATALTQPIGNGDSACTIFSIMGLPLVALLIGSWLPSLSPDLAIAVLGYVAAGRLTSRLLDRETDHVPVLFVVLVSCAGLVTKTTTGVYFGMIALVGVLITGTQTNRWRWIFLCTATFVVVAGAWVVRNAVVSGYPLFPSTWPVLHRPWTVPRDVLRRWMIDTYWHTRGANGPSLHPQWISRWWSDVLWKAGKFQVLFPSAVAVTAAAAAWRFGTIRWTQPITMSMVPAAVGIALWCFTLPEPRFAGAMFWNVAAVCVIVWFRSGRPPSAVSGVLVRTGAVGMGILFMIGSSRAGLVWNARQHQPLLHPDITSFRTESGVVLNVPTFDDRCLDAPLPCTPTPSPELMLQVSGELSSGFAFR